MEDSELDRLLRTANPARTPVDAPADMQLLARITAAEPPSRQPLRAQRFALFIAPLTAVAVAVAAVIFGGSISPAAAYGPAPLKWTPTNQTLTEVAAMTNQRLATSADVLSARRESNATSWSLAVNDAGEPQETTTISPLVTTLEWKEDLSGRRVVEAGEAYSVDRGTTPSDPLAPGSLIDDTTYAAGEYPVLTPDAGAMGGEGFRDLLAAYAPPETGAKAGDAMLGITDIMGEWTLTNGQHGELLDVLLQYDGLTVEGTTTDRLGREVVGLRSNAALRPGETTTLLISVATGRIVGVEITVTGKDASAPVPVGTVIHYALWKDSE